MRQANSLLSLEAYPSLAVLGAELPPGRRRPMAGVLARISHKAEGRGIFSLEFRDGAPAGCSPRHRAVVFGCGKAVFSRGARSISQIAGSGAVAEGKTRAPSDLQAGTNWTRLAAGPSCDCQLRRLANTWAKSV